MAKRITIMMSDEIDKKLRLKQAELIRKTQTTVSYSSVVNNALRGKYRI